MGTSRACGRGPSLAIFHLLQYEPGTSFLSFILRMPTRSVARFQSIRCEVKMFDGRLLTGS